MANCYSQNMYIMQQTFRELAHRWAEAKQPIVKYSTICAYRLALRTHLIPRFGFMVQIHEAEVQEFIVDKMRAGMAKKTVRDIACALHRDAYRRGLCAGVGRCEFATPPPSRASNGGAYLRL